MIRIFYVFLFALTLNVQVLRAETTVSAIDFKTFEPHGVNLTADYKNVFNQNMSVAGDFKGIKVMLVEGIMANYVNFLGNLILKKFNTYQYFDAQEAYLKSEGIDFIRIKLETENSSEKNAVTVAKALSKETKPILLFTHSKGGIDALMALLKYPNLISKVAGIVTIQAPYLGTPVADFIGETQPWSTMANIILTLFGGSGESLADLSTIRRVPWYKGNQAAIMNIQKTIPILAMGSYKNPPPSGEEDSVFKFSRDLMLNKHGIESDGLVPWKSAILPGGPYVILEGVDHADSVSMTKYTHLDQAKFTRALLATFLEVKNHF